MEKYLPIIYVRGYAGSQGAVESTVDKPYYGFNLGATQVRTGPDAAGCCPAGLDPPTAGPVLK